MNIFEFMSDSPWLSFFLLLILAQLVYVLFYKLPTMYLRSKNIKEKGWPPEHLDADGDFKKEKEEEL